MSGFLIIDTRGEFVAWTEHAEVATRRMRELREDQREGRRCRTLPRVSQVVDCRTGGVIAYAYAQAKIARFDTAVPELLS